VNFLRSWGLLPRSAATPVERTSGGEPYSWVGAGEIVRYFTGIAFDRVLRPEGAGGFRNPGREDKACL
jgi:hypothetical protein